MHEIITIQLGQQANYVGAHYWNTQESYFTYSGQEESPVDHDRSFRAGIGADGSDTYTPRALIYDLKGAFGTLRRENELYRLQNETDPAEQATWQGGAFTLRLPSIEESPYQQALNAGTDLPRLTADNVRFWSDFNHVFYHPRSIVQLNDYELNSSLMPFERHATGEDLFSNLDREHDVLDRDLRPFLEECDQLQGIQLFSSIDDAWGGFASRYSERIHDELGKGCRWMFGLENGGEYNTAAASQHISNVARALQSLAQTTSLIVPLVAPPKRSASSLAFPTGGLWQEGATRNVLVDTLTLSTRLRQGQSGYATFDEVEATLNSDGRRNLASASMNIIPPPVQSRGPRHTPTVPNGVSHQSIGSIGHSLEIGMLPDLTAFLRRRAIRGTASRQTSRTFTKYEAIREKAVDGLDAPIANGFDGEDHVLTSRSQLLFPLLKSSPTIPSLDPEVDQLAVTAALETSTSVVGYVRSLAQAVLLAAEPAERRESHDDLLSFAESYEESFDFNDTDMDEDE